MAIVMWFADLFADLMLGLLGAMIVCANLYSFKQRRACTEERQAKYLGRRGFFSNGHYRMEWNFEIEYRGKKECCACLDELYMGREKRFKEGETYTVYVNPDKPYMFRCTNRIHYVDEIVWVGLGGFFLFVGLFGIIGEFINWIMTYI